MFTTFPSGARVWVPPVARLLIDSFELRPAEVVPAPGGERAVHGELCDALWVGGATGVDDGHGFTERVLGLVGWPPNPRYGDWPHVVEWIRVHDPADDPPESGRRFVAIRLTWVEGVVHLAFYGNALDAREEAWPGRDTAAERRNA